MTKSRASWAVVASWSILTPAALVAQHRVGVEFLVNSYTPSDQIAPAIAMDGAGTSS